MNAGSCDGKILVERAATELKIDLAALIASCSLWVHPDAVAFLTARRGHAVWFANTRRKRPGEARRVHGEDGCILDDNNKANLAIKSAIFRNRTDCLNMHVCHIWPRTCYDPRYHTALPNLVLIPAALSALTDYDTHIEQCLKFRSFELYGWYPGAEAQPVRPAGYPDIDKWRGFQDVDGQIWARLKALT